MIEFCDNITQIINSDGKKIIFENPSIVVEAKHEIDSGRYLKSEFTIKASGYYIQIEKCGFIKKRLRKIAFKILGFK